MFRRRIDYLYEFFGQTLMAVALIGLGMLSLIYRGFALGWQPFPDQLPYREFFAIVSGIVSILCGLGLLFPRTRSWAVALTVCFFGSWLLTQIVFSLAPSPGKLLSWTAFAETVMLFAAVSWLLLLDPPKWLKGHECRVRRILCIAFALAPAFISISHFVYTAGTARMIPSWIPFRPALAVFTALAHIAATAGMLTGIAPRLAAAMEGVMILGFVLLCHVPLVVLQPTSQTMWTLLFVATACSGACWVFAAFLPKRVTRS